MSLELTTKWHWQTFEFRGQADDHEAAFRDGEAAARTVAKSGQFIVYVSQVRMYRLDGQGETG